MLVGQAVKVENLDNNKFATLKSQNWRVNFDVVFEDFIKFSLL